MNETKIPTAAEKIMDIKTYFKDGVASDGKPTLNGFALWEDAIEVMKEYAKLHATAALKAASEKVRLYKEEEIRYKGGKKVKPYIVITEEEMENYKGNEGLDEDPITILVDKQSILLAYPLENIK